MKSEPSVVVIGAGVLGLSTAILLQERSPATLITIIAAELPPEGGSQRTFSSANRPSADYASMWAGAHFRPIPPSTPQLKLEAELALRTEARMRTIAKESPESSVRFMKGVELLENPSHEYTSLRSGMTYAGHGDNFTILPASVLPMGVKWGCEYNTYTLDAPAYCQWLIRKFRQNGGIVMHARLERLEDAFKTANNATPSVVINCSGRNLDNDPSVQYVRGQTVLVEQTYDKTVTRQHQDGNWTFLIPRTTEGGTIVGGTKEPGDQHVLARLKTRDEVLERATRCFPDFVGEKPDFVVLQDNVGRRPWRAKGLRIEKEEIGELGTVVHFYGAGGRGFELSWGAAEIAVGLAEQCTRHVAKL